MARISLIPQKREFFDLYNRAAENAVAISQKVIDLLETFPEGSDRIAREVKELEHEGDRFTHEIVDLVNRTFVTPFDRDDMYRLAGALDDICDHVDEAAGKIVGYGVRDIRDAAKEQALIVKKAAQKLARGDRAPRGVQGLAPPAHRAARARGHGGHDRATGDLGAVHVDRRRPARGHPLEGHPRAARGSRRRVRERRRRARGDPREEPIDG